MVTLPGGRWISALINPRFCTTWKPWFPGPKDADIRAIVGDRGDCLYTYSTVERLAVGKIFTVKATIVRLNICCPTAAARRRGLL